jgi:hypothetical protein
MVVALIDEDDAKALAIGERLRGIQAREARSDDDRSVRNHTRLGTLLFSC